MWYSDRDRLKEAKAIIQKYKGQYVMTAACRKELEDAYETIKSIQSKCYHSWEIYEAFTKFHKICIYCEFNDPTYDHLSSGKK